MTDVNTLKSGGYAFYRASSGLYSTFVPYTEHIVDITTNKITTVYISNAHYALHHVQISYGHHIYGIALVHFHLCLIVSTTTD